MVPVVPVGLQGRRSAESGYAEYQDDCYVPTFVKGRNWRPFSAASVSTTYSRDGNITSSESSNGSQAGYSDGSANSQPIQLQHRHKQIELVKARPEYAEVATALRNGTGTPRLESGMSNRRFECERQMWHRSLHIVSERLRGVTRHDRKEQMKVEGDAHLAGQAQGGWLTRSQTKREDTREAEARARSEKLMAKIYTADREPFYQCHQLVDFFSERMNEVWALKRGTKAAVTVGNPEIAGTMVDCCNRFPAHAGYPVEQMLHQDCRFIVQGACKRSQTCMKEVLCGRTDSFSCIIPTTRGDGQKFSNLLHTFNVRIRVDHDERRFIFGVHCDVSDLFMQCDDLAQLEADTADVLSEVLSYWPHGFTSSLQ